MTESMKSLAEKMAEETYPANGWGGIRPAYLAGFEARDGMANTDLIWKIITDFQVMIKAEGLDRDTEMNNNHLSYNDVEVYLYSLLPSPPTN